MAGMFTKILLHVLFWVRIDLCLNCFYFKIQISLHILTTISFWSYTTIDFLAKHWHCSTILPSSSSLVSFWESFVNLGDLSYVHLGWILMWKIVRCHTRQGCKERCPLYRWPWQWVGLPLLFCYPLCKSRFQLSQGYFASSNLIISQLRKKQTFHSSLI